MAYPRSLRSKRFKFARLAANVTLTATTDWTPVVATTWDLTVAAQVGDVLSLGLGFRMGTNATYYFIDVMTIVGGSPINMCSGNGAYGASSGAGIGALVFPPSTDGGKSAEVPYTVQSSDISSGSVTVRPYYRQFVATAGTLYGSLSGGQAYFSVKNIGPPAA